MRVSLERFVQAQDSPYAGIDAALQEIQSGRKRGHWIWYVFPQLAGLGHSLMAERYALGGIDEAAAYLQHPVLRSRLLAVSEAVFNQLQAGVPLTVLMGSEIDALKIVSSMTLFETIAARAAADGHSEIGRLQVVAGQILDHVAGQGFPRCRFTTVVLEQ